MSSKFNKIGTQGAPQMACYLGDAMAHKLKLTQAEPDIQFVYVELHFVNDSHNHNTINNTISFKVRYRRT